MRSFNVKSPETRSQPGAPMVKPRTPAVSHPWPWLARRGDWRQHVVYEVFDGQFGQKDPTNDPAKSEVTLGAAGRRSGLKLIKVILARLTRGRTRRS